MTEKKSADEISKLHELLSATEADRDLWKKIAMDKGDRLVALLEALHEATEQAKSY